MPGTPTQSKIIVESTKILVVIVVSTNHIIVVIWLAYVHRPKINYGEWSPIIQPYLVEHPTMIPNIPTIILGVHIWSNYGEWSPIIQPYLVEHPTMIPNTPAIILGVYVSMRCHHP